MTMYLAKPAVANKSDRMYLIRTQINGNKQLIRRQLDLGAPADGVRAPLPLNLNAT